MPEAEIDFDGLLATAKANGQDIEQALADIEALLDYRKYNKIEFFEPYPKQWEFIALGKSKKERGLFAGNQLGKSECGAFESACHLTGRYPRNWPGYKYEHPVNMWAAGTSTNAVKEIQQTKLFGPPGLKEDEGTGFIPRDCIIGSKSRRNAGADVMESANIRHYTNGQEDGVSTVAFKAYEQGREEFQGKTLQIVWPDEEAPQDIYSEMMARITDPKQKEGMSYATFTPLKGRTDLVIKLYGAPHDSPYGSVRVAMLDVPWMSEQDVVEAKAKYPRHEWEARINGVPMLGEGREFIVPRETLAWSPPAEIPKEWRKLWAIDFGISHPFAGVLMLWDAETDVFYVYKTYRATGAIPAIHAGALREIASEPPVAWPHDGWARDKGSGVQLKKNYEAHGLKMMPTHAHFAGGGYSTEAAISEMHERIAASKFRVNRDCTDWFEEYEEYHRKDGQLVKIRDDLLSATQKGIMMRRYARPVELQGTRYSFNSAQAKRRRPTQAPELNPWTGRPVYG